MERTYPFSQDAFKRRPRAPKSAPRAPQERPRVPQECPMSVQNLTRRRPRASQECPRAPQNGPRVPKTYKNAKRHAKTQTISQNTHKGRSGEPFWAILLYSKIFCAILCYFGWFWAILSYSGLFWDIPNYFRLLCMLCLRFLALFAGSSLEVKFKISLKANWSRTWSMSYTRPNQATLNRFLGSIAIIILYTCQHQHS